MNLNPLESLRPEPASYQRFIVAILSALVVLAATAIAQSPTPSPSVPSVTVSAVVSSPPAPAGSPTATPSPTAATASPTPSLLKKTGIKIQFLPPPMEGTISLGIYDHIGKLVRVLHRAATGDEFVAALDGYITHWDGLDDAGKPLPPGRYSGRGYMVGAVTVHAIPVPGAKKIEATIPATSPAPSGANSSPAPGVCGTIFYGQPIPGLYLPDGKPFIYEEKIPVVLVPNPLNRDRAGSADLTVNLDADGVAWLELADGLPLKRISATQHFEIAVICQSSPKDPIIVLLSSTRVPTEEYALTKVSNMMAFDCGDFDFPGPSKQDGN